MVSDAHSRRDAGATGRADRGEGAATALASRTTNAGRLRNRWWQPPQSRYWLRGNLRIALDVRSPGRRGILTYTRALLDPLLDRGQEHQFLLIKDPGFPTPDRPNVDALLVPSANPLHWFYWSNRKLPELLATRGIELYHTFKHVTAFGLSIPMLVTTHGGPFVFDHGHLQSAREQIYWRFALRRAAASYDGILCATSAEGQFFVDRLGAEPGKVSVVPLAAEPQFRPLADRAALETVRARYRLPRHFLLTAGAVVPVKNTECLVRAFAAAVPSLPEKLHLVIAGADDNPYAASVRALANQLGVGDRVVFLGRVSDDLVEIFNLALAFVFPTMYENFGIALVEAMAVGLPIVCSDISELDDIVGNDALRVNPRDHMEIARAIVHMVNDEPLRGKLARRSRERAKSFSWCQTASLTLEAYEQAMRLAHARHSERRRSERSWAPALAREQRDGDRHSQ